MTTLGKKKNRTDYICKNCGYISVKWLGRCPDCDQWESFEERLISPTVSAGRAKIEPQPLHSAPDGEEERILTGIEELDRVLGGGVVPGGVVLLGGDPGIGKSTLVMHMLAAIAAHGQKVLYASGEESARQIKMRARRLNALHPEEYLATVANVEQIVEMTKEMRPALLVVVDQIGDHARLLLVNARHQLLDGMLIGGRPL